jgi:hypothetical protein
VVAVVTATAELILAAGAGEQPTPEQLLRARVVSNMANLSRTDLEWLARASTILSLAAAREGL